MTRNIQLTFQVLATMAQFILPATPGLPPEWLNFGHAVIAALQGGAAIIGHSFNPDGTSAKVSYEPEKKG